MRWRFKSGKRWESHPRLLAHYFAPLAQLSSRLVSRSANSKCEWSRRSLGFSESHNGKIAFRIKWIFSSRTIVRGRNRRGISVRRIVELDGCCLREVVDLLTRTSQDRVTNFYAGRRDLRAAHQSDDWVPIAILA